MTGVSFGFGLVRLLLVSLSLVPCWKGRNGGVSVLVTS
jgi:hypothetical protein